MRRAFNLLVLGGLCFGAGPIAVADPTPTSRVPLKRAAEGLLLVEAEMGGRPAVFLLDTGSSETIVSPRLARELRLPLLDRTLLTTIDGERAVPRGVVDRLCVGRSCVGTLRVTVAHLASLSRLEGGVDGLLGADFFAHFDAYLDLHQSPSLMLTSPRGLADRMSGRRTPISVQPQGISVAATLCNGPELTMRLDSGATGIVVFSAVAPRYASRRLPDLVIHSDGAPRRVRQIELGCLGVGPHRLEAVPAAVADGLRARAEDGLLPLNLFKGLYLNTSAGYAVFDPRMEHVATRGARPALEAPGPWE